MITQIQPTSFVTVSATASGNTAVWTPVAGKKFRLIGYSIQATANVATAGGAAIDVVFRDGSTNMGMGFSFFAPSAAGTTFGGGNGTGWITLRNGYVSKVADNVLNVNLSAALTAGNIRVNVIGIEE